MPKNNKLKPVKLPMAQRFDEEPTTEYKNNLLSIRVEVVNAPTLSELHHYLIPFMSATWADKTMEDFGMTETQKNVAILELFKGNALPTALETVGITFAINGISLQEVTHILRHRMASFSAECSGDKWWTHKAALVPNSVEHSNGHDNIGRLDFYTRYKNIVEDAKRLYCDMINSKKVSIMDARYILPRCLETFYYMRMNLGDCIRFIKQRMDKQIQPETDNIIAYQMLTELARIYPQLAFAINIHEPSHFYIKTARTGKGTNLYFPDADSDNFEWNENDFIYQCTRNEMNGTDDDAFNLFDDLFKIYERELNCIKERARITIFREAQNVLDI